MTEWQGPSNIENEIKFLTDPDGLQQIEAAIGSAGLGRFGKFHFFRSHVYWDCDEFLLARNDWGFRKNRSKFSYCLKYPIAVKGMMLSRRELFSRDLLYPMDIRNVLHRRGPIYSRIMALFESEADQRIVDARVSSFLPRVIMECSREYFFSNREASPDWLFGIALDRVSAFDAESSMPLKSWCEVEVETAWGYSDAAAEIVDLAEWISAMGFQHTLDSKYKLACRNL